MEAVRAKVQKNEGGDEEDFLQILETEVFHVNAEMLVKNRWKNYYCVLREGYILWFTKTPHSSVEVVKYLKETTSLDTLKEMKVENTVVSFELGASRKSRETEGSGDLSREATNDDDAEVTTEMVVYAKVIQTEQEKFLKRHGKLIEEEKVFVRFANKSDATLFASHLVSLSSDASAEPSKQQRPLQVQVNRCSMKTGDNVDVMSLTNLFNSYNIQSKGEGLQVGKDRSVLEAKYLLGKLPTASSGFYFEFVVAEGNTRQTVSSEVMHLKDVLDSDLDVYDQNNGLADEDVLNSEISLYFKLRAVDQSRPALRDDTEVYTVVLTLQRDLLSYNDLTRTSNKLINELYFQFFLWIYSLDDYERRNLTYALYSSSVLVPLSMVMIASWIYLPTVILAWSVAWWLAGWPRLRKLMFDTFQPYFITTTLVRPAKGSEELEAMKEMLQNESITEEEKDLLEDLREKMFVQCRMDTIDMNSYEYFVLDRYLNTNFRLVKFLRARNNNLKKSANMMKKALTWRIKYEADKLAFADIIPKWLLEYFGCPAFTRIYYDNSISLDEFCMRDKVYDNYSVILRYGGISLRKMFKKMNNDVELMFHYIIWTLETIHVKMDELHVESQGRIPSAISAVIDLKNFKLSDSLPLPKIYTLFKQYLPTVLLIYPEFIQRVLFFNAPRVFYTLWNLVTPLVPKNILSKFELRGQIGKEPSLKLLEKYLAKKDIPKSYGGDLVIDGDELCLDRVVGHGPFLPNAGAELLRIESKK